MGWFARFCDWLLPPLTPPAARRLRAVCDQCGKEVAVIASSGKLWRHICQQEDTDATP